MAVIEEESSGEEDFKSQPRAPAAAAPSGYSSDGYETASDTELNDAVSGPEAHSCSSEDSAENGKSFSSAENGDAGGEVKEEEQQGQTVSVEKDDAEVMI